MERTTRDGRSRYTDKNGGRYAGRGAGQYAKRPGGSRYASAGGSSRYTDKPGGSRYASGRGGSRYTGRKTAQTAGRSGQGRRRTGFGRRQGSKKQLYICLIVFLVLLIVCGAGTLLLNRSRKAAAPDITVSLDSLDSPYAVLIDADTGAVIGSRRSEEKIFPASMVKMMTVFIAAERIKNLDETVTMSYDYYESLYEQDASRAGFEPGEEAVVRDLLYGALLPSGAECCMELAILAAGSEEAMTDAMNAKAANLGLVQTQFANVTGLHSESQFSTPHEIALILQAALKNKTFREVFTTKSYTVGASNVHPDGFTFQSSMFKNMESPAVTGGEIRGGKTGYTDEAGHCLASMAEIDGREYILVTAGWAQNPRTEQYHISDAFLAYNELGSVLQGS